MDTSLTVTRLAKVLVPAMVCAVLLTGCKDKPFILGGGGGGGEAGATEAESQEPETKDPQDVEETKETPDLAGGKEPESPDQDAEEKPAAPVDTEDEESTAPETVKPAPDGPDKCLIGTWQIDNQDFEDIMGTILDFTSEIPAGTNVSFEVSGGSFFRFDDQGQFFSWRDDYTFTMTVDGQVVTFVSNSSETGSYGVVLGFGGMSNTHFTDFLWVDESMIVVTDEVMNIAGMAQAVDRGDSGVGLEIFGHYKGEVPRVEGRESMESSLPFTCVGDTLTLTTEIDADIALHRSEAVQ